MTGFKCDVCGGKVVASEREGWFLCENCGTEYPLEWMKTKFQKTQTVQVEGSVQVEGVANIENLYKRGCLLLEEKKWDEANSYFDKVLDLDAEYAPAYISKLCAELKLTNENKLSELDNPLTDNKLFDTAQRFADAEYSARLKGYNQAILDYNDPEVQRSKAEQGDAIAQRRLGIMFQHGNGVKKDFTEALGWFSKAAEQGEMEAQFHLATMYSNGQGIEVDDSEAFKWLFKAAEQGYPTAQFHVARKYNLGVGIQKNEKEALLWLKKATEQSHAQAQYTLGKVYDVEVEWKLEERNTDRSEALRWYEKAAENGYLEAIFSIGRIYYLESNFYEAVRWWSQGAEKGNSLCQGQLAACYRDGHGVEKDNVKAIEWFTKAALQDWDWAQYRLALLLGNNEKGRMWLEKAAEQGYAEAQYQLALWLGNIDGRLWMEKAAKAGYDPSIKELNGLVENKKEIRPLFEQLVKEGNETAKNILYSYCGYPINVSETAECFYIDPDNIPENIPWLKSREACGDEKAKKILAQYDKWQKGKQLIAQGKCPLCGGSLKRKRDKKYINSGEYFARYKVFYRVSCESCAESYGTVDNRHDSVDQSYALEKLRKTVEYKK